MSAHNAAFLQRRSANFEALTPITFLDRAAEVHPDRVAVVHGSLRRSYKEFRGRCLRLSDALGRRGIRRGDTVAVLCPNIPEGLEAPSTVAFSHWHRITDGIHLNRPTTESRWLAACC